MVLMPAYRYLGTLCHIYSWIPKYVFDLGNIDYKIPEDIRPPENEQVMLVVDNAFRLVTSLNNTMGESLRSIYNQYNTSETLKIDRWSCHDKM